MQLAKETKGGLGDVRELTPYEFELYYAALVEVNRRDVKAMKEDAGGASSGRESVSPAEYARMKRERQP